MPVPYDFSTTVIGLPALGNFINELSGGAFGIATLFLWWAFFFWQSDKGEEVMKSVAAASFLTTIVSVGYVAVEWIGYEFSILLIIITIISLGASTRR